VTLEQIDRPGNPATRVRALPSPDARVALYHAELAGGSAAAQRLAATLSPAEQARARRFGREVLRDRYVIGRGTLRALLGSRLRIDPSAVMLERGRRGRPQLDGGEGIDYNVSHTGDVMLIGIANDVTIGVDVERVDRVINVEGIARRCLAAPERAAIATVDAEAARRRVLQLWTCKEAMSKATGDALSAPFRRLTVDLDAHSPGAGRNDPALRDGPLPYDPAHWTLHAIDALGDHFATVALWRGHPSQLPRVVTV
jgi:4'-phosphopantetheinyl transferase